MPAGTGPDVYPGPETPALPSTLLTPMTVAANPPPPTPEGTGPAQGLRLRGKCDRVSLSSMRAIAPSSHGGGLGVPMGTRLLRSRAAGEVTAPVAVPED